MFIHTLFYVFTYIHNNGDHWKSPPANAIDSLSPEPLEDGGFYSESPSYVFSLLDIKRARSPISLKGTSAIKMCFIIKPKTILSLFSPKWKERVIFKNTYTARDGYTQWSHSEMKREEVKTGVRAFKCGSTFSKYTRYLSNCMSSFLKADILSIRTSVAWQIPGTVKRNSNISKKANKFNPNMMKKAM